MKASQRLVLVIAILASFVAFLDGSVVNVALPAIVRDLGGGLSLQQWVVDSYLITLGALMLLAGSLSDLYGRRNILGAGLIGFGVASLLCAVAPNGTTLIAARGLQGVAGALLVPSSLALIISAFSGVSQGRAIGTWTAWTGMAFLIGPLLGGFFVDTMSWRLVFAINVIPIVITLLLMRKLEAQQRIERVPLDVGGTFLGALGLGGLVYGLIEQGRYGWGSINVQLSVAAGLIALVSFVWQESRTKHPMLPLKLFAARNFSVGNIATLSIYAGLSVTTFLLTVFVQQVGGYSALQAGLALLPVTLIMFALSPRFGALAGRFGPRLFMAFGPILGATGFLLLLRVDERVNYVGQLLPGIVVFGVGLSMTVSPLTTAVLSSVASNRAGIASAVNNMIARVAGLLGIAAIGVIIGPQLNLAGFRMAMIATAGLLMIGGIVSAVGIQNPGRNGAGKPTEA